MALSSTVCSNIAYLSQLAWSSHVYIPVEGQGGEADSGAAEAFQGVQKDLLRYQSWRNHCWICYWGYAWLVGNGIRDVEAAPGERHQLPRQGPVRGRAAVDQSARWNTATPRSNLMALIDWRVPY